ncbi:MAG: hypothetical protein JEZ00_12575, partial [Anaerolineaceae bacterium]|nr:hypothetical protein [Anaerolineaceae bacterium]
RFYHYKWGFSSKVSPWPIRRRGIRVGIIFIVATLTISTFNPLNQYIHNYKYHEKPVLLNMEPKPFPNYFHKTEVGLPGVLSIYDGFFTFRFLDLIEYPLIEVGETYTPTRTSLWTMLYARTHSIHFNNYPSTWATDDNKGFNLTRAIFILALLPTLLILFGFLLEVFAVIKSIFKRDKALASTIYYGLAAITFFGYLCFIVIYALLYRDFSVMKPVFIYPAILIFPIFFIHAVAFFKSRFGNRFHWISAAFTAWMVALLGLYAVDVFTMIQLITSRME